MRFGLITKARKGDWRYLVGLDCASNDPPHHAADDQDDNHHDPQRKPDNEPTAHAASSPITARRVATIARKERRTGGANVGKYRSIAGDSCPSLDDGRRRRYHTPGIHGIVNVIGLQPGVS
jgi:hypothetical protein